ncbi:hypothetical protein KEM54_004629 [Ascosphaera aggregata]|nr:hypothetical protein KEM54_004629 [Ascosphaera aggregata]
MEELINEPFAFLPLLEPSSSAATDKKEGVPKTVISDFTPVAAANGVSEYYFRDFQDYESRLIFYVVHTVNRIIYNNGAWRAESGDCRPPFPTTIHGFVENSYLTPEDLLSAAELIAANMEEIPAQVLILLKKVIDMRDRMHEVYIDIIKKNLKASGKRIKACARAAQKPHWHFMSYLKQVWYTWNGDAWLAAHEKKYGKENELSRQQADELLLDMNFILEARFIPEKDKVPGSVTNSVGDLESNPTQLEVSEKAKEGHDIVDRIHKRLQVIWQIDGHRLETLAGEDVEDFNLRIPPEFEIQTDYHIAYICLVQQANEIRAALRDTWLLVALGQVPLAAAALLTHIGIATISYHEGVLNKVIGVGMSVYSVLMTSATLDKEAPMAEQFISPSGQSYSTRDIFLLDTYNNLLDFLVDYRVNKNGKPTDQLRARFVEPWDPDPDLRTMNDEQRHAWLRTYTMKWLYDFMNFYVVGFREYFNEVRDGTMSDSDLLRCNIDGHATEKRRLMGLNELAYELGNIILDRSKPPKSRLLFGQVFQVQCLIDAFLVTRGWQFNTTSGQEFKASTKYDPLKDIESFFSWSHPNGFGPSFADARRTFHDEVKRHRAGQEKLSKDSLSLCQQIIPLFNIIGNTSWRPSAEMPQCVFHDPDGIWRYSPFLSGSALAEALTIGSTVGVLILDRHTEVFAYAHLQNMLLKKGFLKKETKLYEVLCGSFQGDLFPIGVPESDFKLSLHTVFQSLSGVKDHEFLKDASRSITTSGTGIGWRGCHIFNMREWAKEEGLRPSLYQACSDAEFLVDAVPYHALPSLSYFEILKIATRTISGMEPEIKFGSPYATPQVVEIVKEFYTADNAGKDPSQLPFAATRPDIGNILYRLRCDLLSEAALSSYLNYPCIVADIIQFYQELMAELKQEHSAGKNGDGERGITFDCDEPSTQGLGRESRLLAASQILSLADATAGKDSEEAKAFLGKIARVMERCSRKETEEYFYHGHDPATLERLVRDNMLRERRHAPECTML